MQNTSFFIIFSINVNSTLFKIGLEQKWFLYCKNICFVAIQNGCKSNRVVQTWMEVCHEIFDGWEKCDMYKKKMG